MSLDFLVIYQSPTEKIRVGSQNDGGYVISSNQTQDCLMSCGIADDINFEKEFLKQQQVPCIAFDGTIPKLPEENSLIQFFPKNITSYESDKTTNLHNVLNENSNIFLKMDIETFEFRWIHSLSEAQLKNIKQMVIEFHFPFTKTNFKHLDEPLEISQKIEAIRKLTRTHHLIHLHANNCCSMTTYANINVPNVFECTFLRKDCFHTNPEMNTIPIPHSLDRPNLNRPEIYLSGQPFTR